MDREQLSTKIEELKGQLDKIVKNTTATKAEIDALVREKMDSFVKMVESNNIEMVDLSNNDNKLYQKLCDRSKTIQPGDDINDPESLYKYEVLTSQFMRAKKGGGESVGDKIVALDTSSAADGSTSSPMNLLQKLNRNFMQSQSQSVQQSMDRFDWLNSSDVPFQSFQQQKKSGRGYRQAHSVAKMPDHNVSALQLHLLGMTKRSFFTRKNVMEFLQTTEQKAKEKAKIAVEEYITASK